MSGMEEWKSYGPALVRPLKDDLLRWEVMPAKPKLRLGTEARPSVTIVEAAGLLMMTATAEFGLDESELAKVAQTIVREEGLTDAVGASLRPEALVLEPAPFAVSEARLVLGTQSNTRVIAKAKPSGFGSQAAAFSATLMGPDVEVLKAALSGTAGNLSLIYDGVRSEERIAEVNLSADAVDLGDLLGSIDVGAALDDGLRSGVIRMTKYNHPSASEALKNEALEQARAAAHAGLARIAGQPRTPDDGYLLATAKRKEAVDVPFSCSVDVRL